MKKLSPEDQKILDEAALHTGISADTIMSDPELRKHFMKELRKLKKAQQVQAMLDNIKSTLQGVDPGIKGIVFVQPDGSEKKFDF